MSLYTIGDVELEIDMEDYDFQKKYEEAFHKMEAEEKEVQNAGMLSDFTKRYCQMFYNLFDHIFGDGTSKKLFGEKYNSRMTEEVYEEFVSICGKQAEEAQKRRNKYANKYKPNQQKRRAK